MNTLVDSLTLEQIPEGIWKAIAEEIGIDNLVKLCELCGGATIYLPRPESITRPARDAQIRKEYNGYNHLELARRYGLTERHVRRILDEGQLVDQLTIFDYGFESPALEE